MAKKNRTNILIIGGGRKGAALIDLFYKSKTVNILGVVDSDPNAPGLKLAAKLGIPTSDDYAGFLDRKELDEVINVTGDRKLQKELLKVSPRNVEIISGHSVEMIWSFVEEHIKAEEELKLAYIQLDQIFQGIGEGMYVVDRDSNLVRVNNALLELLGKKREEVSGRKYYEVFPRYLSSIFSDIETRIFNGEERIECDVRVEREGAIKIPCILTATPFYGADGKVVGIIGTFKDISGRKSAEEALLENIRMKNNFTSMVSHELRTPLTAIREGIGIVLDGSAGEINEEQKDFLTTAKRNVDRLTRLVNDVLDFAKFKAGKMTLKMVENDIKEVIEEVVKSQKSLAEAKGLYLKVEIPSDIPRIRFDFDRITQVVTNFVNNAVKFTGKGGVYITAGLEKDNVYVCVKDTGPGIKRDDVPKLFQEFRQLEDEKRKSAAKGTGLGLAICREIIKQHGGMIWVESEYGKGSEFKFTLPVKRKYKILIVDDDEEFQNFCDKLLTNEGYEVIRALNGVEGIKAAGKFHPDLMVLDMRLPDISGYEIIGRLRSETELFNIPVLAVSGYVGELEELEEIKTPDERSTIPKLSKPFDNEDLLSAIAALLEQKNNRL